MEKEFKIIDGDISDGYHTFGELYEHRCLLWIAYVNSDGCPGAPFCVHDHFEGWDLLAVDTLYGQISYHVPNKYRKCYGTIRVLAENAHFDGHTSKDVVERLLKICKSE